MEKRAYISYFLLAIFALIYTHQLIPHHEHHHEYTEEVSSNSCSRHQEVVSHIAESATLSHFLDHLFDGDFHFDIPCTEIFYKNLKFQKNYKALYSKTIEFQTINFVLQSKTILYECFVIKDKIHLSAFSLRGPPQLV